MPNAPFGTGSASRRSRALTGNVTRVGFFSMKKLFLVKRLNCSSSSGGGSSHGGHSSSSGSSNSNHGSGNSNSSSSSNGSTDGFQPVRRCHFVSHCNMSSQMTTCLTVAQATATINQLAWVGHRHCSMQDSCGLPNINPAAWRELYSTLCTSLTVLLPNTAYVTPYKGD